MREDADGFPTLEGAPASALAVRPSVDIPVGPDGTVLPRTGGMSVTENFENLLPYRLPVAFGGSGKNLFLFKIDRQSLPDSLFLRHTPSDADESHHDIEPMSECQLDFYSNEIRGTRTRWSKHDL